MTSDAKLSPGQGETYQPGERRGMFVVLEGGEGSGKTSNMSVVVQHLAKRGIACIETREPGGTPMAEEIRSVLLNPRDEGVSPDAELLLMFAARAQHLHSVILPALEQGKWVICDRFTDATYAYQGAGRKLGDNKIASLEQLVQGDLRPDRVLLLDVALEIGMARAKNRGALDRMESEAVDFFQRVRNAYLSRAGQDTQRYTVVDAGQSMDQVADAIRTHVDGWIEAWQTNT